MNPPVVGDKWWSQAQYNQLATDAVFDRIGWHHARAQSWRRVKIVMPRSIYRSSWCDQVWRKSRRGYNLLGSTLGWCPGYPYIWLPGKTCGDSGRNCGRIAIIWPTILTVRETVPNAKRIGWRTWYGEKQLGKNKDRKDPNKIQLVKLKEQLRISTTQEEDCRDKTHWDRVSTSPSIPVLLTHTLW